MGFGCLVSELPLCFVCFGTLARASASFGLFLSIATTLSRAAEHGTETHSCPCSVIGNPLPSDWHLLTELSFVRLNLRPYSVLRGQRQVQHRPRRSADCVLVSKCSSA